MSWEHDERHIWIREPVGISVLSSTISSQERLSSRSAEGRYINFVYEVNGKGVEKYPQF